MANKTFPLTSHQDQKLTITGDPGDNDITLLSLLHADEDFGNGTGINQAVNIEFKLPANQGGDTTPKVSSLIRARKAVNNDWYTGSGASTNFNGQLEFFTRKNDALQRRTTLDENGMFTVHNGGGGANIRLDGMTAGGGTHYIELSSNLSGHTSGAYNALKTNLNDLHFDAGGVYTGYISGNTGFNDISDQSLKENVVTIDGALSKVEQLQGRYFTWINENQNDDRQIGFIAQEVEAVVPELVTASSTGIKGMSYGKATALLVEAIKEQQTMIEQLQARLTAAGIE